MKGDTMAKPFRFLWDKMAPDAQAAAEQQMQAMLAALPVPALQQARQHAPAPAGTSPKEPRPAEVRKG